MTIQLTTIDLNRTYTADEFEQLPDDGNKYELINGRIVKMPPPGFEHGSISSSLFSKIILFDPKGKWGKPYFNAGFVLDENNTPLPDLLYIVANRIPSNSKGALQIIPDLVVEVLSPSQITKQGIDDDSMKKIRKYQDAKVKIIWSINPDNQTVEVYHPDKVEPVQKLTINDELNGEAVLPKFKLAVKELFV